MDIIYLNLSINEVRLKHRNLLDFLQGGLQRRKKQINLIKKKEKKKW